METAQPNGPQEHESVHVFNAEDIPDSDLVSWAKTKALTDGNHETFHNIHDYIITNGTGKPTDPSKTPITREGFIEMFGIQKKVNEIIETHNPSISNLEEENAPQKATAEVDLLHNAIELARNADREDVVQLLRNGAITMATIKEEADGLSVLTLEQFSIKFGLNK